MRPVSTKKRALPSTDEEVKVRAEKKRVDTRLRSHLDNEDVHRLALQAPQQQQQSTRGMTHLSPAINVEQPLRNFRPDQGALPPQRENIGDSIPVAASLATVFEEEGSFSLSDDEKGKARKRKRL